MGKCVAYVAAAVVCLGIGALTAGLIVWYTYPQENSSLPSESRTAKCHLAPTTGNTVEGTITLHQRLPTEKVNVSGVITGLKEGKHGFHVHEWGVMGAANGCKDAAGHYNPGGFNHAGPNDTERHVGDLGNIESGQDQTAVVQIEDHVLTLWGLRSVVGRAIVVHADEDDLGRGGHSDSLTTGHAGARVACCTIYLAPEDA